MEKKPSFDFKQLLRTGGKAAGSAALWLLKRPYTIVCVVICAALIICLPAMSRVFQTKSRTTSFSMKDIGELSTQSGYFTVVSVMDDSVKLWDWSVPLTSSKYIFSYDGVVKAGLDFAELEFSVDEEKHAVTVRLPRMKLLSAEILEDSLEIYDERNSIFTPLELADFQASRLTMLEEIREKAVANGLLEQAAANAETLIRGFLSGRFDPNVYTFIFVKES